MSLLCATNFSPSAIEATTAAAELARQRGEELWLVHVLPSASAKAFGEAVLTAADGALQGEAARAHRLGAHVTHALLIGNLATELPRFCAENKVGLVIAGDTQRPATFAGTGTLASLAQKLNVPLLVVREAAGFVAWAKGQRPLKVMLAVDRTESTAVAGRWLKELAAYGKLEVIGGHIFWPPGEYQRLGLAPPLTWDEPRTEVLQSLHQELIEKLPLGDRVRLEPGFGRPSDHLCALAAQEGVDLLVLGTHHRWAIGRLWSVSHQCLQLASMSVACVPASADKPPKEEGLPPLDRVLIATDFSPAGDRAVAWGLAMLAPGGTADLVHVVPEPVNAAAEKELLERLLARVPAESRPRHPTLHAHVLAGLGGPADKIVAAAERFNSRVICVGSRSRSLVGKLVLGSVAREVLDRSARPVVLVKPPEP